MEKPLDGRVAFVTGGSRGLGAAFAHGLTASGAKVALTSREEACAQLVIDELLAIGASAVAVEAEMRSRASVNAAAEAATQALGPIDILVNNADTCIHAPALDVTEEDWADIMETNVNGVWYGCQAVGRQMIEAGRRGSIVNIGSMSAAIVNRPQMQPACNASKAAVHHLTRSLAAEWDPSASASMPWRWLCQDRDRAGRRAALPAALGRRCTAAALCDARRDRADAAASGQRRCRRVVEVALDVSDLA